MYRHEARMKRMQKVVRTAAQLHEAETLQASEREARTHRRRRVRPFVAMLTLTYADEVEWNPRHVTGLVKAIRDYLARRGVVLRYVWVLELTKRERPHYHLLVWLPPHLRLPKPDDRGWWPWGSTRIERARSAVGYISKYASKGQFSDGAGLPKGARLAGNGGLSKEARITRSWRLAPAWVRELWGEEHRPIRAPGGGWLSRLTGDYEPARWRLVDRVQDWSALVFVPVEVAT